MLLSNPFFPAIIELAALHTKEGKYIYLDQRAFAQVGINVANLMDRRWQEFTPPEEIDAERRAIERVLATGEPVTLDRVRRDWAPHPVFLEVTISSFATPAGVSILHRHARVLGR